MIYFIFFSTIVSASITMVKNKDRLTCGLEGANGNNGTAPPTNLIFSSELTFDETGTFDADFCKNICISKMLSYWDNVFGGSLCCTFID